jgi:septum formation protein
MTPPLRLYLASQSPRRRELLDQLGVPHDLLALRASPGRIDVPEIPHPGESAADFALRMAIAKAAAGWYAVVARRLLRQPVLGADTDVECDGVIFGKPAHRADAAAMLARLSGRVHRVHSAVAVQFDDRVECVLTTSEVEFARLSLALIERYLDTGEYHGKAGAYGIQGRAARFVTRIDGSYTGIVGLPLAQTADLLTHFGFDT